MTWLPRVTAVAFAALTARPPAGGFAGMGTDQMLARAVYTAYDSRFASAESEIVFAPRPVVRRTAAPRGRAAEGRLTRSTSRRPSGLDTKKSLRPSPENTGL